MVGGAARWQELPAKGGGSRKRGQGEDEDENEDSGGVTCSSDVWGHALSSSQPKTTTGN